MSHALNLAISQPLLVAAPAAAIILILVVLVALKLRGSKGSSDVWLTASEELGIDLVADGSELGPVARGRVNDHVVTVAPVTGKGRKARKSTQYSVKFEATEAPQFRLIKRDGHDIPPLDTGNPKFDAVVVVQTDQAALLTQFLTPSRRAAILRLLSYWPDALISNREVHLTTAGIEDDHDTIVDAICHLVATAETFDRLTAPLESAEAQVQAPPSDVPIVEAPTVEAPLGDEPQVATPAAAPTAEAPITEASTTEASTAEAPLTEAPAADVPVDAPCAEAPATDAPVAAEADVLTEVRLDEITVLSDLFNSDLMPDQIAARFEQIYQGRDVSWSGEVVRVGPPDETGRQRIAALIGSADGQNPDSGRVVALTAVGPEPVLSAGDVVSFSGSLVNLDAAQRLFHVV